MEKANSVKLNKTLVKRLEVLAKFYGVDKSCKAFEIDERGLIIHLDLLHNRGRATHVRAINYLK